MIWIRLIPNMFREWDEEYNDAILHGHTCCLALVTTYEIKKRGLILIPQIDTN